MIDFFRCTPPPLKAHASPIHSAYLPHIDGLRALAVLAVIVYHLNPAWLPGGFVGVDVFFVISGYVVTASLKSRAHEPIGRFIAGFYARRLIRVAPALLVMLLATALFNVLYVPPGWLSGVGDKTLLYAVFGLSNVLLAGQTETYFAPRAEYNAGTHTWSLGVEEQFYLLVPLLLFGWFSLRYRCNPRAWIFLALIALLAVGSALFARWTQSHAPLHAFYSLASRFWELAVGSLLCLLVGLVVEREKLRAALLGQITGFVGIGLLIASYLLTPIAQFPWPFALLAVAASALLIGTSDSPLPNDGVRRVLASRVLVAVGLRSYSLYLWHWPIFVLMRWTVGLGDAVHQFIAVALTAIFAEGSYRLVEQPIRQSAWLRSRSASLQLLLLLSAVVGAALIAHGLFALRPWVAQSTVQQNAMDWYATDRMVGMTSSRLCTVDLRYRAIAGSNVVEYHPRDCKQPASRLQLFVLGDSHAGAYLAMFDQFAAETGAVVRVYHLPGCPFLPLHTPMAEVSGGACVAPAKAALADVTSLAKATDIVFLPSLRVHRFSDQWSRLDERAARAMMSGDHAATVRERAVTEASGWLTNFIDKPMRVLFELPKPVFHAPPFRCSDVFNRSNEVCAGRLTIERADMLSYREPAVKSIESLMRGNSLISAWDPLPALCPDAVCSAVRQKTPLYFDGDHISAAGSRVLYSSFKQAVCGLGSLTCEVP